MIIQVQSCRLYIVKWIKVPAVVEREDLLMLPWMSLKERKTSKLPRGFWNPTFLPLKVLCQKI